MSSSNYSENELRLMAIEQSKKIRVQRLSALNIATDYIMRTSTKNICDFLNSGKLDTNKEDY